MTSKGDDGSNKVPVKSLLPEVKKAQQDLGAKPIPDEGAPTRFTPQGPQSTASRAGTDQVRIAGPRRRRRIPRCAPSGFHARLPAMKQHHEAIVVGAGVAGIYQIKRLVDLGIEATVLEAGGDLGGTWYWNRYPGARFDSESWTYGYSFSRELLDEWHWKEHFSGQPENLRYLNRVADKFGLRKYMQFNCQVDSARYDEAENLWHLERLRRARAHLPLPDPDARAAVDADPAQARGHGELQGPVVPYLPLAARAGRHGGQARRRDRHRRHRHPGDRRDRRQGGRAHRVPAPAELELPAQQRADLRKRDGRHPPALRRDLRRLRALARRLRARARPPRLLRGEPRGAAGAVGQALRRARASASGWRTSARSSPTRRPMPSSPSTSPSASAGGSRIPRSPRS